MKLPIPFIVFTAVFLLLANRHIFTTTLTGLQKPQAAFKRVEDQKLSVFIQNKSGVTIQNFIIVNSELLFAGMTAVPTQPVMTISKNMYETFSEDELNYIVLHETGHYVHGHAVNEIFIQLGVIIGSYLVFRYLRIKNKRIAIASAATGGVIIGILMVQLMRQFEWQADAYALQRLDDPQAMISATQKLQNAWGGPADGSVIRKLFYRGIPYSERVGFAESYQK